MKTILYVRVSSTGQDIASQMPDISAYAAGLEAKGEAYEIVTDKFTGKSMNREGWQRVEAAIAAGEVNRVVVWRIDRLGRTAAGLTSLFDRFTKGGINFVSLREGIDLSTISGRLMSTVIAGMAQYETEVRAERVAAGIAAAKANGVKLGGSKRGWQSKRVSGMKARVKRMLAAGVTKADIAAATGLHRATIIRLARKIQGEAVAT